MDIWISEAPMYSGNFKIDIFRHYQHLYVHTVGEHLITVDNSLIYLRTEVLMRITKAISLKKCIHVHVFQ